MAEPGVPIWERQDKEPDTAFYCFSIYLDMGPFRTLPKLKQEIDRRYAIWQQRQQAEGSTGVAQPQPKKRKKRGEVSEDMIAQIGVVGMARLWKYSMKYSWTLRVKAWQDEIERVKRLTQIQEVEEMAKRHANLALLMQQRGLEKLQTMTEQDSERMSPTAAAMLIREAIKIERQARGQPGEIVQQDGTQNVKHGLDDQSVQALRSKIKKLPTAALEQMEEWLSDDYPGDPERPGAEGAAQG